MGVKDVYDEGLGAALCCCWVQATWNEVCLDKNKSLCTRSFVGFCLMFCVKGLSRYVAGDRINPECDARFDRYLPLGFSTLSDSGRVFISRKRAAILMM